MADFVNYLVPILMIVLVVVLVLGLYTLFKGGDVSRSYSNKLMRLRVLVQFVIVMVMMLGLWLAS